MSAQHQPMFGTPMYGPPCRSQDQFFSSAMFPSWLSGGFAPAATDADSASSIAQLLRNYSPPLAEQPMAELEDRMLFEKCWSTSQGPSFLEDMPSLNLGAFDGASNQPFTTQTSENSTDQQSLQASIAAMLRSHVPSVPQADAVETRFAQVMASPTANCHKFQRHHGCLVGNRELGTSASTIAIDNAESPELGGCSTLMIRNVPLKLAQRHFMKEVNEMGFRGKFDFLYIPMDSRRRSNRGIAFINFVSATDAQEFAVLTHGRFLNHPFAEKCMEVLPADCQGFEQNIARHAEILLSKTETNKPMVLRKVSPQTLKMVKEGRSIAESAGVVSSTMISTGFSIAPSYLGSRGSGKIVAHVERPEQQTDHDRVHKQFCTSCGMRRNASFRFCPLCGFSFEP